MNPQTLPFNPQFQSNLLYLLITDFEFLRSVVDDLTPNLLDAGESHIKLLKCIIFLYRKLKRSLSEEIVKNTIIQGKANNIYTSGDVFGMNSIIDAGKFMSTSEKDFIKEKVFEFMKTQTMALAFSKSLSFFEKGDFDEVYRLVGEAYKKSYGKEYNIGINYSKELVYNRYLDAPRKGIWSTGFPTLDSYLGGGIARKECATILSPSGRGKCLGINTPILMSDGTIKLVQNIKVGDKLMGPNGKSRNVLSTTLGQDNLYKIIPVKGDPYIVNSCHILSLKRTGHRDYINLADGQRILPSHNAPIFVMAEDLFNSTKTVKHCLKGWRPEAVDFENENTNHPIPPYILGVWLGDGTSAKPEITQLDSSEVVEEFKKYAKTIDCKVIRHDKTSCPTWSIIANGTRNVGRRKDKIAELPIKNEFTEGLRKLNLIKNKHIPNEYIITTKQARLELLAGLLDTDGSLHYEGYDFIQKDETLAKNVAFIARSLGLQVNISKCKKGIKSTGFEGEYWWVNLSGDCSIIPVKVSYKKAQVRKQIKNHLLTGITIEQAGFGDYYGFEIDGDRQFLLGDWQVTHNTALLCNFAVSAAKQNMKTLFITLEMSELQIAQRFDSIISGFSSKEIMEVSDAKVALQKKLDTLFSGNINSLLTIKGFDRGTLSLGALETYLEKYSIEFGAPHVIVLDWLGCMRMPAGFEKKHEALAEVGDTLVNFSRQFNCSLLTAHQTNRSAVGADTYSYDSISESFASIFGFDIVLGLGSSNKAQEAGKRTLTIQKSRVGPDSVFVGLQGDQPNQPLTFKFVEAIPEEGEEELLRQENKK